MTIDHRYRAIVALDTLLGGITGLGSHSIGGRFDANLPCDQYPAFDLIDLGHGKPDYWPAEVVETMSTVAIIGRVKGIDLSALSELRKALLDIIATDSTLGGEVIDVLWGQYKTDEGAFDNSTFWIDLVFWHQDTYGSA